MEKESRSKNPKKKIIDQTVLTGLGMAATLVVAEKLLNSHQRGEDPKTEKTINYEPAPSHIKPDSVEVFQPDFVQQKDEIQEAPKMPVVENHPVPEAHDEQVLHDTIVATPETYKSPENVLAAPVSKPEAKPVMETKPGYEQVTMEELKDLLGKTMLKATGKAAKLESVDLKGDGESIRMTGSVKALNSTIGFAGKMIVQNGNLTVVSDTITANRFIKALADQFLPSRMKDMMKFIKEDLEKNYNKKNSHFVIEHGELEIVFK